MRSGEGEWLAAGRPGGRAEALAGGQWLHEGLAVACARRFLGRSVPMEELLQEARAAICLAEERFEPERGCCFSTYAVPVALGALREYCRRAMPVAVPRRMMDDLCPVTVPLDAIPEDLVSLAGFEDRLLLRHAIRRLGEPYARIIGLRYFCGMSQREVGLQLKAAQWQVCRWEKAGLERLRIELYPKNIIETGS